VTDLLELSAHLPEVELAAGDVLIHQGGVSGSIWVLVSGTLEVTKDGEVVNVIRHPGASVGELSVLLGTPSTATVTATAPTRVRHAADGSALLGSDPAIGRLVAAELAARLDFVTTYLVDLKHQYADVPGLAMVADVVSRLADRKGPVARPGSAREPEPEY
jgi:CRP-like cAMP-binding protein